MNDEIIATSTSRQEFLIEQSKYQILVENELRSLAFDTSIYKKFASIVFLNIIVGGFFAWASAGDGSNIYNAKSALIIVLIVDTIFLLWPITVLISALNIKKSIDKDMLPCSPTLRNTLIDFIKPKVEDKCEISFSNIKQSTDYFEKKECQIRFFKSEFENYVKETLKSYAKHTSFTFYHNYTCLILFSLCLEELIEQTMCGVDAEYSITISKRNAIILAKLLSH